LSQAKKSKKLKKNENLNQIIISMKNLKKERTLEKITNFGNF